MRYSFWVVLFFCIYLACLNKPIIKAQGKKAKVYIIMPQTGDGKNIITGFRPKYNPNESWSAIKIPPNYIVKTFVDSIAFDSLSLKSDVIMFPRNIRTVASNSKISSMISQLSSKGINITIANGSSFHLILQRVLFTAIRMERAQFDTTGIKWFGKNKL